MNRRVLAALLTLADVHEAKETPDATDEQMGNAYGRHGVALAALLDDYDHILYGRIAGTLCAAAETIHTDPEGAALLELARGRELPTRVQP